MLSVLTGKKVSATKKVAKVQRSQSNRSETISKASDLGQGQHAPYERTANTRSSEDLGFYGRTSVGLSFELEDDDLERLVGKATHISLRRISSKGLMRVPSKERFSLVRPCSRANVLPSSGRARSTSQGVHSDSPRSLLRKGSESLKRSSPEIDFTIDKSFGSGITMVEYDGENDDDSEDTKKEIEVYVNGVRTLIRASSRRRLIRSPALDRPSSVGDLTRRMSLALAD